MSVGPKTEALAEEKQTMLELTNPYRLESLCERLLDVESWEDLLKAE